MINFLELIFDLFFFYHKRFVPSQLQALSSAEMKSQQSRASSPPVTLGCRHTWTMCITVCTAPQLHNESLACLIWRGCMHNYPWPIQNWFSEDQSRQGKLKPGVQTAGLSAPFNSLRGFVFPLSTPHFLLVLTPILNGSFSLTQYRAHHLASSMLDNLLFSTRLSAFSKHQQEKFY